MENKNNSSNNNLFNNNANKNADKLSGFKEMIANKKVLYYGIGAIVIVLVVFYFGMNSKKDILEDLDKTGDQQILIPAPTEDTSFGSIHAKKETIAEVSMTYDQALLKYKDARIQLGNDCQATPNNVTYKNKSTIMLDNRSASPRVIKIGSSYPVKAYGFKLIEVSEKNLPSALLLDCDNSENVATVLIQQ